MKTIEQLKDLAKNCPSMAKQPDVDFSLIAKGANPNAKDHQGRTPLAFAQEKGHTEIAELLQERGAKE